MKDIDSLFPFLIIVAIGLLRLFMSKKKPEEPTKKTRPAPVYREMKSAPPSVKPPVKKKPPERKSYIPLEVRRDEHFWQKKKRSRIQTLVAQTGDKRNLILLSEILKRPKHF